jgi:hypothetical protein
MSIIGTIEHKARTLERSAHSPATYKLNVASLPERYLSPDGTDDSV